ncbi:MAG TPA: deoxynucleoside kinase, partial [Burkholderiaceae bacterium]|nr:deoxynucleoside kinase [Burkholderiaceae bacterium]
MRLPDKYHYVVIEGPIGAGKTSLATKLAQRYSAQTLLEQPEANPFLERFYRDQPRYALPTQLFFLFQRVQQLGEVTQLDLFRSSVIADFLLEKDSLFTRLTLADNELKLYEQIFAQLKPQAPLPDLVIYLQAPPDTLVERVLRRGSPIESGISETYLR